MKKANQRHALVAVILFFAFSTFAPLNGSTSEDVLKLVNMEIERRARVSESVEVEDPRYIEVESSDGRKLQARIIEHDGETLKFYSLAANQEYEVSFDRLSEKTQKLLREEVPTRFLELPQGWADRSHHGEEANAVADVLRGLGVSTVHERILDPVERQKHFDYVRKNGLSPMHGLASFSGLPHFDSFPMEALRGDLLGVKTFLYGSIEYLMDLHEAEQLLKGIVDIPASSQLIICPGFPDRAFRLHLYQINREYREDHGFDMGTQISGYNSIGLAVDGRKQVVAVQLNRTTAVEDLMGVGVSGGGHRLFNFLEYKKSATPRGGVGIGMSEGVSWRCHLYQSREFLGFNILKVTQQDRPKPVLVITKGFSSDRRAENYSRLMMHANVARVLLYNIDKNWLVHDDAFKRVKELDMDELIEIRDKLKALSAEGEGLDGKPF